MTAWKPHESFLGLLMAVSAKTTKAGKAALVSAGLHQLSFGRIGVLAALQSGTKTQAELSRELHQASPSMMEMLERLEKEQLIKSAPHPTDGRKEEWSATAAGRRVLEKSSKSLISFGKRFDSFCDSKNIQKKEMERFKSILKILNDEFFSQESGV